MRIWIVYSKHSVDLGSLWPFIMNDDDYDDDDNKKAEMQA
jgi:hypothetical protein